MIRNQEFNIPQDDITKSNEHTDNNIEQLRAVLQRGLNNIALGNTRPFAEAMVILKTKRDKSI